MKSSELVVRGSMTKFLLICYMVGTDWLGKGHRLRTHHKYDDDDNDDELFALQSASTIESDDEHI